MKLHFLWIISFLLLFKAVFAADANVSQSDGANGLNPAIIQLTNGDTITFTSNINLNDGNMTVPNLRPLNTNTNFTPNAISVTIDGDSNTLSGASLFRGFFLRGGSVTIQDLNFSTLRAQGGTGGAADEGGTGGGGPGLGGALFIDASTTCTLQNVSFSTCSAHGGTGGSGVVSASNSGGGGGGGFTGNGGQSNGNGAGGGGGLYFAGGTSTSTGAGGGGGTNSAGVNATTANGGRGGNNFAGTLGGTGGTSGSPNGVAGSSGTGGGGGYGSGTTVGAGGAGNSGGGGGGGGFTSSGTAGAGGNAGVYGGGGGGGSGGSGDIGNDGGDGVFGGGGGGGFGFQGGGDGGTGGFGSGGGGGGRIVNVNPGTGGSGGTGGGNGANPNATRGGCGGGGAGFGGSIFMRESSTLTITGTCSFTSSSVQAGAGGTGTGFNSGSSGSASGTDIYMMSTSHLIFNDISGTVIVPNAITSNSAAAGGGLTKSGTGTARISGANTYTGTTTVSGGTLEIASGGSITTTTVNLTGGTLSHLGNSPLPTASNVTLSTSSPTWNLNNNAQTLSTTLNFNDGTINAGTTGLTLSTTGTAISSTGDVIQTGLINLTGGSGGTLNFAPTTTSTLASINLGSVVRDFTVSSGTLGVGGTLSGTGGLRKLGAGILALSGSNTYQGDTTASAGTLRTDAVNTLPSQTDLIINGGTVNFNSNSQSINTLNFTSGTVSNNDTLTLNSSGTALSMGNATLGGTAAFPNGQNGNIVFTTTAGTVTDLSLGTGTHTISNASGTVALAGTASGAGSLEKTGAGNLSITSGGGITVPTFTISAGALIHGAADQFNTSINVIYSGGTWNLNSFSQNVGVATLNANFDASPGITVNSGGDALVIGNGVTQTGMVTFADGQNGDISFSGASGTVTDLSLGTGTHSIDLATAASLQGTVSGAGSLEKIGTGNLTVASGGSIAPSSFTMSTGTLTHAAAGQFGSSTNVTYDGGTWTLGGFSHSMGSLTLNTNFNTTPTITVNNSGNALTIGNGVTQTGTVAFSDANNGNILFSGSSGTVTNLTLGTGPHTISNASGTANLAGTISGTGSLEKMGAGTLSLSSGASITASPFTINGGSVSHQDANQIAAATSVTLSSGSWNLNNNAQTLSTTFNFNGGTLNAGTTGLTLSTTGTAISSAGNVTQTGLINLTGGSGGALDFSPSTTSTLASINLGSVVRDVTVSSGTLQIGGTLSGTGGLRKLGAGLLTLSGSNTYQGNTTASAGTLRTDAVNTLPSQTDLIINGGTVNFNSNNQSINTLNFTSGTVSNNDTLTLNSSGTALSMGNATLGGTAAFPNGQNGNIVFTTTSGTVTDLSLGTGTHTISNASGTAFLAGTASGAGSLEKTGAGNLSIANGGSITVPTFTISDGALIHGAANQFNTSIHVIYSGGTWNLNSFSQNVGMATLNTNFAATPGITVNSSGNALVIGNGVTQTGTVTFAAGQNGNISFSGVSGTVTNLSLGTGTHSIDLATAATQQGAVSGTGSLEKTGAGNLTVAGGGSIASTSFIMSAGTLTNGAAGQFGASTNVTYSGGTWNLGGFSHSMGSLLLNLDLDTSPGITVNNSGNALTIANGVTQTGTVTFANGANGGLLFSGTSGTATSLVLGTGSHAVSIASGSATIQGTVSGSGTMNKTGAGTLELDSGASVTCPELLLTQGTLRNLDSGQISTTTAVTQEAGIWDFNSQTQTAESFTFNGGTISNAASLSLSSTSTALTMRNTNFPNQILLTGGAGGNVVFDGANGGTAQVNSFDLGGVDRTFTIASSFETFQMVIDSGTSSGGALIKEGPGSMRLTGLNDYSGTNRLNAGTLHVDGTLNGSAFISAAGSILKGTGTVSGTGTINGIIQPGGSIGQLTLDGDQTFTSSSVIEIELDPNNADFIQINGSLTIDPGATISFAPTFAIYPEFFEFTLIQTTGGITGRYDTILNPFALFEINLLYPADLAVVLSVGRFPFSALVTEGNPGQVAAYLDEQNPQEGTDFAFVIENLQFDRTVEELIDNLNEMHPADLKGLTIAAEETAVAFKSAITDRALNATSYCLDPCAGPSIWLDIQGNLMKQGSLGENIGFSEKLASVTIGMDQAKNQCSYAGAALSFGLGDFQGSNEKISGDFLSLLASLYGVWGTDQFVWTNLISGGWNHYETERKIAFQLINRKAVADFEGWQLGGKSDFSWLFYQDPCYTLALFASIDYTYLHQSSFKEKKAQSLNLSVRKTNYDLLREEIGIWGNLHYIFSNKALRLEGKLAYSREDRFGGRKYSSKMEGAEGYFTTKGMQPDRNLFLVGAGIALSPSNDSLIVSLRYQGEFGKKYANNFLTLGISY